MSPLSVTAAPAATLTPSRHQSGTGVRSWLTAAVVLGLLVLGLRAWVLTPYEVVSDSMAPTLSEGSTILVDRVSLRVRDVRSQDLVMIDSPEGPTVKRVVALAGDRVEMLDAVLHVNGTPVDEPYVDEVTLDGVFFGPVDVPPGHVFVLGDNRFDSIDSRTYGPVPTDRIQGRVMAR